jgi:hypothetical protein
VNDLLGDRSKPAPACPPCKCGSTRASKSVIAEHFFCLDCGELIEPSEHTDDPRQMDFLS